MTANRSVVQVARLLCVLATTLCAQIAQATPNWQINPGGTGAGDAQTLSTLDVGGSGFVQVTPITNTPFFQFVEHGAYQALKSGSNSPFGTTDLTITYAVTGNGSFWNPAALRFTSGIINVYADSDFDFATTEATYGTDNGKHVASFNVYDGSVTGNGQVAISANLVANSLLRGYLFSADGIDLADLFDVQMQFSVFNQMINPDATLVSEIVCQMAEYKGPGCVPGTTFVNSQLAYTVQDGGKVTITAVPEPGSIGMMLLGLGLLSLSTRRRQRSTH